MQENDMEFRFPEGLDGTHALLAVRRASGAVSELVLCGSSPAAARPGLAGWLVGVLDKGCTPGYKLCIVEGRNDADPIGVTGGRSAGG